MWDECEIETSPLSGSVTSDGATVAVLIYRVKGDPHWILEVSDQEGGSTVWDDLFSTDGEALTEALNTIENEDMACFLRSLQPALTDCPSLHR